MLCILVNTKVTTALISYGLDCSQITLEEECQKLWPIFDLILTTTPQTISTNPKLLSHFDSNCFLSRREISNKNCLWSMGVTLRPTVYSHLLTNHFRVTSQLGLRLRHFKRCSLPNSIFGIPASWAGFLEYSWQSNDLCSFNVSLGLVCARWNIGFHAFPRYLRIFSTSSVYPQSYSSSGIITADFFFRLIEFLFSHAAHIVIVRENSLNMYTCIFLPHLSICASANQASFKAS